MKLAALTDVENKLYQCLKYGKENAVRREVLVAKLELSDRKVRKHIEEMRHKGIAIISSCSTPGYWLAENDEEKKRFFKMMDSYGKNAFRTTTQLKHAMKEQGQDDLFEQVDQ